MNKLRYTFLLACSFLFLLTGHALAQDQKIGFVNTDVILSKIPEYQGIEQQLQKVSQEWKQEIDRMRQEIERLKEDFAAREILYTEEIKNQKQQEIQNKVQQLEQFRDQKFGPQGDYFTRQQELLEPIQERVFNAISTVAEQEGFDFVFDRSQQTGLMFGRPEWNLNEEVLVELGITPDETSN